MWISRFKIPGTSPLICFMFIAVLLMTGCSAMDEDMSSQDGMGNIAVTLNSSTTRSTTSTITKEEADLFLVTIYKGEELVSSQFLLGNIATLTFPAGYGYKVFVENITSDDAESMNDGWGAKRYTGLSKSFGIQAGQTTKVGVGCSVANAAVTVTMADGVAGCMVTITSADGRTLSTSEPRTAYFNVAENSTIDVSVVVEKDGVVVSEKELSVAPAEEKNISLKPGASENEANADITITYDSNFEMVETEIPLL